MKNCPYCGNPLNDDAAFCTQCGHQLGQNAGANPGGTYAPQPNVIMVAPYDHTREFDPKDVSDNKVYCMAIYLMSVVGIIIGLLAAQSSPYVVFHVRQALKFAVLDTLLGLISLVLCWTVVMPILAGIAAVVLLVVRIICFVQICQGKAVEPAIIRSFGFLK
ncbi:MAG: zinc-ribbon domain-containing protein [Gemmiger formicilis]|uniref:zinc-ribbon domain-containing protein n=1 Tax=Gemmiger formicilis TaxID=745368 RepID=UPI003FEFBD64|nr:zinc-ribbon domain-containing protein [Gemmiger formicilis]